MRVEFGGGRAPMTMTLLTVTALFCGVGGAGALGDLGESSSTVMATTHQRSSLDGAGAAGRSLLAMGINDVEAAVSRLYEAKRDALEYANK